MKEIMRKPMLLLVLLFLAAASLLSAARAVSPPAPTPATRGTNAPAPSDPPVFPIPVETFLMGDYLERGDVVLTRRDWDLTSYIIRKATNSPFSHAALVFAKANQEPGITQSFVIEAGTGGVDLTNLADYIDDKSAFIAIKRLPRPWFDGAMKARVRGVLLDKIKGSYDYWAITRIARSLWFGVQDTMQKETPTETRREKTIKRYRANDWTPPNDFICSGLVQTGFVQAVVEYIKGGVLPPAALSEVVFSEASEKWLPDAEGWEALGKDGVDVVRYFERQNAEALNSVTPEDLARSDKLEWLYLIRAGVVHRIHSYEDALAKIE